MGKLYRLTEGDFSSRLDDKLYSGVYARESTQTGRESKYEVCMMLNGPQGKIFYFMRHGRTETFRTWRLDALGKYLKAHNVISWQVSNLTEDFSQ
jgi:hypothetical protein